MTQKVSTYYKAGNKLISNVKSAYNATTDGSGQNLELLAEGSANVAFVQGDVYNHWINSHPQFADKFTVIVTDRTEHVQLIMRDGMTEDDIQKKKVLKYSLDYKNLVVQVHGEICNYLNQTI